MMHALEVLLRLRQAACHSGLLPNQTAATSSKITLLINNLLQLIGSGHKALVFSQWTSFLDYIQDHLRANNIEFVRLDGSTRDRKSIVERFQSEGGPPIFLSSLKAGGTGLNLTAADYVFLMDPWWNPAAEDQAADRAHRIGQERPVIINRIVTINTVEESIIELQKRKREIAEAALGESSGASSVTKDELLALLQ
jgi:SNF2 family DNA or RNA helicase